MGKPFHGYYDQQLGLEAAADINQLQVVSAYGKQVTVHQRSLSYLFATHFHPYVPKLVRALIEKSVSGLQEMDTDYVRKADGTFELLPDGKPKPVLYEQLFSNAKYDPSGMVAEPYPVKDLDFTSSGAYSVYNWELFYHVPFTIAIHLSKNQHFEDAMRWFHYVFDPTDNSDGPTPERFWKVKPFQYTDVKLIEEILVNLATGADPALQQDTINNIHAWKDAPFRPHVVARYRQTAYMFKTVMAYLDNLIAWGDSLFRQDTGEAINEAEQLYVLAANILGPRPQSVPKRGSVRAQTYANFKDDLDAFGNALVEFEGDIGFDNSPSPGGTSDDGQLNAVRSIGNALYFCIPRNDKLLGYWDTVADRLFKIRNSLNIQGIFRQLPLFEPPIDPALLARAAASGLDVSAIIGGLNQPLPLVRFQQLLQKAVEICQEVKSLGSGLLSAIEKEDNEALTLLRAHHERIMLGLVEAIRYGQLQEAAKTREGLEHSIANAAQRFTYYERLLGKEAGDISLPELDELDKENLLKLKFKQGEPALEPRDIDIDVSKDTKGITEGKKVSSYEVKELDLLQQARSHQDAAVTNELISSDMSLIPEFGAQAQPMGAGAAVKFGGMFLAKMFSMMAMVERERADQLTFQANKAAKIGSYARREQEWALQSNLAGREITQLFKQLRAAQIREAVAEREWTNHQQQIRQAEEVERFLTEEKNGKTANKAFYTWLRREVKGLYQQCFQFAFDVAKKAERALQHELGDSSLSFLQFGYLSGKQGLLAGEKLHLDIKRMEMAYQDLNRREYELTRHVSLLQLDPKALLQLRAVGRCTVFLPEELFDLDCPGHYFRRIKSVSLSIPSVSGPYSSVNCTLTLLKSSVRQSPQVGEDGYARSGAEDPRFSDHFGSLQSIVTSSGQNDAGLFETNLRDERYLPFEGSGAVSEWQLELPSEIRQFNYDTISDVIIHLRYTAREGGVGLRNAAVTDLKAGIEEATAVGSVRLFSVRHEFPGAWAKFKSASPQQRAQLSLDLSEEHYPFWSRGNLEAIKWADLYARTTKTNVEVTTQADGSGPKDSLVADASLGNLRAGRLKNVPLPSPTGTFHIYLNDSTMTDLWLGLAWGKE
ncbi:MAG: insecticidal toxin protein [Pyrinomonadaceae bacterium]